MWWQTLIEIPTGILLIYAVQLGPLWGYARRHPAHGHRPRRPTAVAGRAAAVRRLAADRGVPTGMRVLLVLLLIYPVSPVDLVPDFLPNGGVRPPARLATHCRRGSDPGLVDKRGSASQPTMATSATT